MPACLKEEYWDRLLYKCMPCTLVCQTSKFQSCTEVCRSIECSKREGFYYDNLIRKCMNCTTICGQHPWECQPFCRSDPATLSAPAALAWKLDNAHDQRLVVYLVLGLCLCTLLFSLLLTWVYFRKQGEEVTCRAGTIHCHKKGDIPKECLMEAGSMGSGSSGSQTPDPVETCGFCFPEQSLAVQESRACHRTYQLGAREDAVAAGVPCPGGTIPTPEDGHFQIICSPSQEKMQMT
ncbi:tumor necrosis factor receptor superfamily member 13B [Eublepharis macularius]|uniref:Tumor necrosis factor receptor superfamily member 13B n=1 Tax=Eublepharis macularius TaxID=481883 RepID=A0AA97LE13_EUBMA|nr:tumor necrosis factor receptor superfamily member 13B [Eublepharis macularius]